MEPGFYTAPSPIAGRPDRLIKVDEAGQVWDVPADPGNTDYSAYLTEAHGGPDWVIDKPKEVVEEKVPQEIPDAVKVQSGDAVVGVALVSKGVGIKQ